MKKEWKIVITVLLIILIVLVAAGYYFINHMLPNIIADKAQDAFGDMIPEGQNVEEYVSNLEPAEVSDDICEKVKKVPKLAVPDYALTIYDDCLSR